MLAKCDTPNSSNPQDLAGREILQNAAENIQHAYTVVQTAFPWHSPYLDML